MTKKHSHDFKAKFKANLREDFTSDLRALKSFSQNFLKDAGILNRMGSIIEESVHKQWPKNLSKTGTSENCASDSSQNETNQAIIFEVGPGTGALSRVLAQRLPQVQIFAVEKDARAVSLLEETLEVEFSTFKVQSGDILNFSIEEALQNLATDRVLCVGNLPYAISSEFLLWFCANKKFFRGGHFLLQKEVANRLSAAVGTKAYGRLTAFLALHYKAHIHFDVPPEAFTPRPKVTSTFFSLEPLDFGFENSFQQQMFEKCSAFLFSSRRKMLRKTVEHLFTALRIPYAENQEALINLLEHFEVSLTDRPERMSPECLYEFSRYVCSLRT